jgi:hypothetical protein
MTKKTVKTPVPDKYPNVSRETSSGTGITMFASNPIIKTPRYEYAPSC